MANKKRTSRKSRRFNLRRVRCTPELPLGTLSTDTALVITMTGASANRYRCMSISALWQISALTADEGPLTVGYAHSDYSVSEIKACLESVISIDIGDKIAQELSNRLVRVIGTIDSEDERLNDGLPVKTKLNWDIGIGDSVNAFVFNEQTGSLTTGASLKVYADMWVKD